jgi:hypothetical protein
LDDCKADQASYGCDKCLTHASKEEFEAWLTQIGPGSEIYLGKTRLTKKTLERIKQSVSGQDGRPHFGHLSLRQAEIDGPVDLRYSRFTTETDFFSLKTSSYVDLEGAQLEKGIKASFIEAPEGIDFYRAALGGGLDLTCSKIGDRLRIARCGTINGSLILRTCEIDGELEIYDITVSDSTYLSNMAIEGDFSIRNSSFTKDVQCFYTTSNRDVILLDCRFLDRVDFEGLRVGHDLTWDGTTFQKNSIFDKGRRVRFHRGCSHLSRRSQFYSRNLSIPHHDTSLRTRSLSARNKIRGRGHSNSPLRGRGHVGRNPCRPNKPDSF